MIVLGEKFEGYRTKIIGSYLVHCNCVFKERANGSFWVIFYRTKFHMNFVIRCNSRFYENHTIVRNVVRYQKSTKFYEVLKHSNGGLWIFFGFSLCDLSFTKFFDKGWLNLIKVWSKFIKIQSEFNKKNSLNFVFSLAKKTLVTFDKQNFGFLRIL